MIEPMHCTALDRKTACGLDIRGKRSTRQPDLVTCVVCQQRLLLELFNRGFVRAKHANAQAHGLSVAAEPTSGLAAAVSNAPPASSAETALSEQGPGVPRPAGTR